MKKLLPIAIALLAALPISREAAAQASVITRRITLFSQQSTRTPLANADFALTFSFDWHRPDSVFYGRTNAQGEYIITAPIDQSSPIRLYALRPADSVIVSTDFSSMAGFQDWQADMSTASPWYDQYIEGVFPIADNRYQRAYMANPTNYMDTVASQLQLTYGPGSYVTWTASDAQGTTWVPVNTQKEGAMFDFGTYTGLVTFSVKVHNAWLGGKLLSPSSVQVNVDTAQACGIRPGFAVSQRRNRFILTAPQVAGAWHRWEHVGGGGSGINRGTYSFIAYNSQLPVTLITHEVIVQGCTTRIAQYVTTDTSQLNQVVLGGQVSAGGSTDMGDSVLVECIGYSDTSYQTQTLAGMQNHFNFTVQRAHQYLLYATPTGQPLRAGYMPTYYGNTLNWSPQNLTSETLDSSSNKDIALIPIVAATPPAQGGQIMASLMGQGSRFALPGEAAQHTYRYRQTRLLVQDSAGRPVGFARGNASGQLVVPQMLAPGTYTVTPETPLLTCPPITLRLTAGQTADLSFYLAAATITGNRPAAPTAKFEVYPNPSQGKVSIRVNGQPAQRLRLTDALGRQTEMATNGKAELELNLPAGLYQVQAIDETGRVAAIGKVAIK